VLLCVAPGDTTLTFVHKYPVEDGVKTTLIVQADPTATVVGQLLVWENWLVAPPLSVMLVIGSGTLPAFVTVIACDVLLMPSAIFPNDTVAGETVNGTLPVPFTMMVCVTPDPLTFNCAQLKPAADGVKTTLNVHVDPPATELPQVLVCENSPAPGPVKLIFDSASAPPLLVNVTTCPVLDVPI
jgi:hypothetical protein